MSEQQDRTFMATFVTVLGILVVLAIALIFLARYVQHLAEPSEVPANDPLLAKRKAELLAPVGRVEVAGSPGTGAEGAPPQTAAAPVPAAGGADGKAVYQSSCFACHGTGAAGAPKVGDRAAWEPRAAQGIDTLVQHAIQGKGAMPPKGGNMALGEAEIRAAIEHMLRETGLAAGGTAKAAPAPKPAPAAAAGEGPDLAAGERVYQSACFACHGTGAAGAPRLGDRAAWKDRIAQGIDTLVQHAIQGKGAMPPKGGRADLDERAVRDAVAYMVSKSR